MESDEVTYWWDLVSYVDKMEMCDRMFDHNYLHRLTYEDKKILYLNNSNETKQYNYYQVVELLSKCWSEARFGDSSFEDFLVTTTRHRNQTR